MDVRTGAAAVESRFASCPSAGDVSEIDAQIRYRYRWSIFIRAENFEEIYAKAAREAINPRFVSFMKIRRREECPEFFPQS